MTEELQPLYWAFLEAGNSPALFWELSVCEANDALIGYSEELKHQQRVREGGMKDEVVALYHQAEQIANMLSRVLAGKHANDVEIRPLSGYYPEWFREAEEAAEAERAAEELAARQQRFKAFAERHNARMRGREDGDSGIGDDAGDPPGGDPGGDSEVQTGPEEC